MKLNKTHREVLLNELNETNEQIELQNAINRKWSKTDEKNKPSDDLVDSHDIKTFLLLQKKELILESLIENQIDF